MHASYSKFFDVATSGPEVAEELKQAWIAADTIFSDIAANELFTAKYPLDHPAIQKLIDWLYSAPPHTHLQIASCLALGNLACFDEAAVNLAGRTRDTLGNILYRAVPSSNTPPSERPNSQLLHAVLGFLKNLAIPNFNKPTLAYNLNETGLMDSPRHILPQLWACTSANPQVQFQCASLTRSLLVHNPPTSRKIIDPLPEDTSLTYRTREGIVPYSFLHMFIDVALRSDTEPTKMEVARAVCSVIRVLYYNTDSNGNLNTADGREDVTAQDARAEFFDCHTKPVAAILSLMLTQKKHMVLRSEAIFIFGLISRSVEGTPVLLDVFYPLETCRVLAAAVSGRKEEEIADQELGFGVESSAVFSNSDSDETEPKSEKKEVDMSFMEGLSLGPEDPQQAKQAQPRSFPTKADRENAIVLLSALIDRCGKKLGRVRSTLMTELLKQSVQALSKTD